MKSKNSFLYLCFIKCNVDVSRVLPLEDMFMVVLLIVFLVHN